MSEICRGDKVKIIVKEDMFEGVIGEVEECYMDVWENKLIYVVMAEGIMHKFYEKEIEKVGE